MNARDAAERHAQDSVDGNFGRLMGYVASTALTDPMFKGATPRNPISQWSIGSQSPAGEPVGLPVRCRNDSGRLALATTWEELADGSRMVAKAEKVGA